MSQNRSAALGRPAMKLLGGFQLVCGRPILALSSALIPQTLSCLVCVEDFQLISALSYKHSNQIKSKIKQT